MNIRATVTPENPIYGWHASFYPLLSREPFEKIEVGSLHHVSPPIQACKRGLHLCPHLIDCFAYTVPRHIWAVSGWGDCELNGDKWACEYRRVHHEVDIPIMIGLLNRDYYPRFGDLSSTERPTPWPSSQLENLWYLSRHVYNLANRYQDDAMLQIERAAMQSFMPACLETSPFYKGEPPRLCTVAHYKESVQKMVKGWGEAGSV